MSAALTAALRARAASLYPDEAGTGLLIRHGGILLREDFAGFVHTRTTSDRHVDRRPAVRAGGHRT